MSQVCYVGSVLVPVALVISIYAFLCDCSTGQILLGVRTHLVVGVVARVTITVATETLHTAVHVVIVGDKEHVVVASVISGGLLLAVYQLPLAVSAFHIRSGGPRNHPGVERPAPVGSFVEHIMPLAWASSMWEPCIVHRSHRVWLKM